MPRFAVFMHLPGDVETLGPVLEAARSAGVTPVVGAPAAFLTRADVRGLMSHVGLSAVPLGGEPDEWLVHLGPLDALLTASETTLKPHRAAHVLTQIANEQGVRTYTLQHGFENVGLTYFDAIQGVGVRFAAQHVFVWGAPEKTLLADTPAENKAKVIPAGRPAFCCRPPAPAWPIGAEQIDVAVFENLHWHRFDDAYRQAFLADLSHICEANPDWQVLIKPHPQGRWLTQRYKGAVPAPQNLIIADPADPKWSQITGAAVVARAARVLTTPSTVALDAAQAGVPVALFGYGLPLANYAPLPVINVRPDLDTFLRGANTQTGDSFVERVVTPGDAAMNIIDTMLQPA